MGCLHHWSCFGKGFVNVSNVDDASVGSVVWGEGGGREGERREWGR